MNFSARLQSILSNLDKTFHPDELAYLAATSKIEGPIRDRVAYQLHAELSSDLLVHREWRGANNRWTDIAVTDEQNRPHYLLELKAHSAPTFERGYSELIRKDLLKLREAGEESTELYLVFLFNHLYNPGTVDAKYQYAVKYYSLQNFASKQNHFAVDVRSQTKLHWELHLQRLGLSTDKTYAGVMMKAGNYHGMPLWVHAYVLGPMYRNDLSELIH